MKIKRELSGVYYRVKNEDADRYENVVFEDLTEQQQDEILDRLPKETIKGLAKILANTINALGDAFDIGVKEA